MKVAQKLYRATEITQSKDKRERKRLEKKDQSLEDLLDATKISNRCALGALKKRKCFHTQILKQ
jgi:hypothetical protein